MKVEEISEEIIEYNNLRMITFAEFEVLSKSDPAKFMVEIEENTKNGTYVSMKQSEILPLKHFLHNKQNGICPLLKIPVDLSKMTLDHQHKLKADIANKENGGLVRGALDFRANALEGKIVNGFKRLFGSNPDNHPISCSDYLRNLADYLENPPCPPVYIHPNETQDLRTPFNKNDFNRILKYWKYLKPGKALPSEPKAAKRKNKYMTKDLLEILPHINLFHLNVTSKVYRKLKPIEVESIKSNYFKVYPKRKTYHIYIGEIMYDTEEVKQVQKLIRSYYVS